MGTRKEVALFLAGLLVIGLVGGWAIEELSRSTRRGDKTALLLAGLATPLAIAWWGFTVMTRSAKGGFMMLRFWLGGIIGIAIASSGLALHPLLLFLSIPAGAVVGSLIATGKVWRVWEDW